MYNLCTALLAAIIVRLVFADANYGRYCNVSSAKGLQQISTALYVVRTLNEHNYVPGQRLGERIKLFYITTILHTEFSQRVNFRVNVVCMRIFIQLIRLAHGKNIVV